MVGESGLVTGNDKKWSFWGQRKGRIIGGKVVKELRGQDLGSVSEIFMDIEIIKIIRSTVSVGKILSQVLQPSDWGETGWPGWKKVTAFKRGALISLALKIYYIPFTAFRSLLLHILSGCLKELLFASNLT